MPEIGRNHLLMNFDGESRLRHLFGRLRGPTPDSRHPLRRGEGSYDSVERGRQGLRDPQQVVRCVKRGPRSTHTGVRS